MAMRPATPGPIRLAQRLLTASGLVCSLIAPMVPQAFGAATYYEVWRSNISNSPSAAVRIGAWLKPANDADASFTFIDPQPLVGISWYFVRAFEAQSDKVTATYISPNNVGIQNTLTIECPTHAAISGVPGFAWPSAVRSTLEYTDDTGLYNISHSIREEDSVTEDDLVCDHTAYSYFMTEAGRYTHSFDTLVDLTQWEVPTGPIIVTTPTLYATASQKTGGADHLSAIFSPGTTAKLQVPWLMASDLPAYPGELTVAADGNGQVVVTIPTAVGMTTDFESAYLINSMVQKKVVGFWRFDEESSGQAPTTSDAILDESGSNNHGTATGGPQYITGPTSYASNRSLLFDGSAARLIQVADNGDFGFGGNTSFTVEGIVRLETAQTGRDLTVAAEVGSTGAMWYLRCHNDTSQTTLAGRLELYLSGGSGYIQVLSDRRVDDGRWHHVAMVHDALTETVTLYIDYQPAGSGGLNSGWSYENSGAVYLGGAPGTLAVPQGALDVVRIAQGALTVDEFLQPVPEPGASTMLLVGVFGAGLRGRGCNRKLRN